MSSYVDPPTALALPERGSGRRATAWTFGTGCATVLASVWSLGTVLVVPWHPAPRRELLAAFAVTVLLGLVWLLASRLAPVAERAEPAPPRPRPSPAELRDIARRTARRSRWSVLTGWAAVLPAIWVVPVAFLTAHQPLEQGLMDRHAALVAAGARWTDSTVALSTAEAQGRPRERGRIVAVHPAGHPEMSLAVVNERGKLNDLVAGDNLRILIDLEHPGSDIFPEPLVPLLHPGRPFATVGFRVVLGVMLLIWWCILFGVLDRRLLLPTRRLRVQEYPLTADPPATPPVPEDTTRRPPDWRRVRVHGTVLQWSFRSGSDEDSGTTWRAGLRLDPEAAGPPPDPGPGPVAFQDHAARLADAEVAGRTAARLAGSTGWLGRQAGGPGGELAVLVLDDGETRWGLPHTVADDPPTTGEPTDAPDDAPADAPAEVRPPLRLPPPVLVLGPLERVALSALALYPMGVIWLNTTGALRRFNGVAVFAVEVVGAAGYAAAGFGLATLVERWRKRRRRAPAD